MQIYLTETAQYILRKIKEAGHEAYAVGGCVRDSLMNNVPKDWDIATSMLPHDVKRLFPRTFDTGLAHGTVTVVMKRESCEVTTFRVDGEYFDSRRRSSVTFTRNIADDLSRRDFTINAMAYNEDKGLVDLFGGQSDLALGRVRAVGDPARRFTEDALRMLRAVRFAAQLDFDIEEDTFRAVSALGERLNLISAERIRDELVKLLMSAHPQKGGLMETAGILPYVLRGRPYGGDLRQALDWAAKCPGYIKTPHHVAMRVAMFFYWAGEGVVPMLRALRFDNNTIRETAAYVKRLNDGIIPDRYFIKKYLEDIPDKWFFDLLYLQEIMGKTEARAVFSIGESILRSGECYRVDRLTINGDDLIAAGIPQGRAVGEMLSYLLDEVRKEPELNQPETLLKLVQSYGRAL